MRIRELETHLDRPENGSDLLLQAFGLWAEDGDHEAAFEFYQTESAIVLVRCMWCSSSSRGPPFNSFECLHFLFVFIT